MFGLMPFERNEMDLFNQFFGGRALPANSLYKLNVDLEDKGDHFELTADLPGFDKDDIKIDIEDKIMTIEASREEKKESTDKNYICRERRYGSYTRSFDISGIQSEDIKGSFKNGVLTILMPKKEALAKVNRRLELSDGDESPENKAEGAEE